MVKMKSTAKEINVKFSCLADSFAKVLRMPVEEIYSELGHDGGEIIWPYLKEPNCRRSFHPQEFFPLCFKRGYILVTVEAILLLGPDEKNAICIPSEAIGLLVQEYEGVLLNENHAVAWMGEMCHDPRGRIYSLSHFFPTTFIAFVSRG